MASTSASAYAARLEGMHDLRLRPRLLHALLDDCLPHPNADVALPQPRPADLAYAADAIRAHGLLAEHGAGAADPGTLEAWGAAVDAWVDRLIQLMGSDRILRQPYCHKKAHEVSNVLKQPNLSIWHCKEHGCWVGSSFLGLTIQECCDKRFRKSFSDWFGKLLEKMKASSSSKMVNMVTCTAMYDLFLRLATFSNLKDEAISSAQKVVNPSLQLLQEDSPVVEKAVDLLGLLMKLFPSSVYRHFNKVESSIITKIMSGSQYNAQQSKKLASTLALLPYVRVSRNSMSLMIQKILFAVNSMLNNTFPGLEEEHTNHELMMLLTAPDYSKLVPLLGSQTTYGDKHIHSTKKFHEYVVPTIEALIHCCSALLTNSYPTQVINIPVRALLSLIRKVLLIDEPLLLQSRTHLCRELICSEIPTMHSIFLDLLVSTVKGMRSSLIPHADIIVTLIAEYFKRAKLPAVRRRLYTIVQLLLSSMGIGMAMQLFQVVVSNVFSDLDNDAGSGMFSLRTDSIDATICPSSKRSSNRKQVQQVQCSNAVISEPAYNTQTMAPLCVSIAALETLEVLLNVGGLFRACPWRTEMDLLLIDIATKACYEAGMYEQRTPWTDDSSISDFQIASFRTLLASFLSNPHERSPYLEQGLELFSRGKLETGTELAIFCSHALLALDILLNPRQRPAQYVSKRAAHDNLGFASAPEQSTLGSGRSQPPCSVHKRRANSDLGDECKYQMTIAREPTAHTVNKDSAFEKHARVELSEDISLQKNDE